MLKKIIASSANPVSAQAALAQKAAKAQVYAGFLARFPRALKAVARVSEYGAKKYSQDIMDTSSFLDLENGEVKYKDALVRHLLDEVMEGRTNASDGDVLHMAQIAWCAMAGLEIVLRNDEVLADFREIRKVLTSEE